MTFRAAFYKGTRPGLAGIYNRLIRWWDNGKYSHCELIFSDGQAASASYLDGGIRFKQIDFDPARWTSCRTIKTNGFVARHSQLLSVSPNHGD